MDKEEEYLRSFASLAIPPGFGGWSPVETIPVRDDARYEVGNLELIRYVDGEFRGNLRIFMTVQRQGHPQIEQVSQSFYRATSDDVIHIAQEYLSSLSHGKLRLERRTD